MNARIDTAAERARLDGLTGHDPAPWCTEYDEWDSLHVTTLERLNEPLVPIAKVGVDYDEPFESRQQACASLIAAAPDLLVGYRAALDEIDRLTAALAEAEDRGAAMESPLREAVLPLLRRVAEDLLRCVSVNADPATISGSDWRDIAADMEAVLAVEAIVGRPYDQYGRVLDLVLDSRPWEGHR